MRRIGRRTFLGGAAAFLAGGCRTPRAGRPVLLTFGVVSDLHLTTPASCRATERALRAFRDRGVDAVVIPGDITDWGLKSGLVCFRQTWDRVFSGTDVVPLCCTGDHDDDGWTYPDMAAEMRANGFDAREGLTKLGLAKCWEETFGERFEPIRIRTVKGFSFVSGEYHGYRENLGPWLERHADRLTGGRPFFYLMLQV